MRRAPAAVATALGLLATVLLAAGCGGEETQGKAAWVEQADGICASAEQDLNQAADEQFGGTAPSSEDQAGFVTDEIVPNLQQQHDEIADLPAPEGAEEQAEKLLEALQSGIDTLKDDPSSVAEAGEKAPLAEAGQLADGLGLTDCGG